MIECVILVTPFCVIQYSIIISCISPGVLVVVELKDDSEICGVVEESDKDMNLVLIGTKQTFPNGSIIEQETAFVNGPSIRYVHFPKHINAAKQVNEYLKLTDKLKARSKPHQIIDRTKRSLSDVYGASNSSGGDGGGTVHGITNGSGVRLPPGLTVAGGDSEIYLEFGGGGDGDDNGGDEDCSDEKGSSEDHLV